MTVSVRFSPRLRGQIRTPGDKSISHRAVMISALADGTSRISGLSGGQDVRATSRIVAQLGATIARDGKDLVIIGSPLGLSASPEPLDCGNSGTTMRLMCGLLASAPGDHILVGDASLSRRPMDRVARPLGEMGLRIEGHGEYVTAPLRIRRSREPLSAIDYDVPVPSAQVKSAILFAALASDGPCVVHESVRTRANTEEMLGAAGVAVTSNDQEAGRRVRISPGRPLSRNWSVPGDPSQAAFFVVLGCIHRDAEITVVDLYEGPERIGFLAVLQRMGAAIDVIDSNGHLSVTARSSDLVATDVDASEIPSVDEVPVLAVAAAAARGRTRFRDVGELRIKESDRLAGTMDLVRRLGAAAQCEGDDLIIEGLGGAAKFAPFEFESELDHRMVMAAAVAGAAGQGVELGDVATVSSSYPDFFHDLAALQ